MNKSANKLMDDLYEMSETEFEAVYELTKRGACVRFGVEAYTVGYQDAYGGHASLNQFSSARNHDLYAHGFADGTKKRRAEVPT